MGDRAGQVSSEPRSFLFGNKYLQILMASNYLDRREVRLITSETIERCSLISGVRFPRDVNMSSLLARRGLHCRLCLR